MSAQYFGCYRGIVTTSADPEGRKRIKAQVPQLLGEQETDWAWPCLPVAATTSSAGDPAHTHQTLSAAPSPGQGVWVMFEGGDISKPVWIGVTT